MDRRRPGYREARTGPTPATLESTTVEPIPPTREAIEKLERLGDADVERILRRLGERVVDEVPT